MVGFPERDLVLCSSIFVNATSVRQLLPGYKPPGMQWYQRPIAQFERSAAGRQNQQAE